MVTKFKKNRKKSSLKGIFSAIFLGILLLTVLGFLIITNIKIKQRRERLLARVENLKNEVQILEEKNEGLRAKVSQAGSRESLEKIAREQLGLKAPGEEIVVISKEKGEEKKEMQAQEEKGFWNPQGWWDWIKNKVTK